MMMVCESLRALPLPPKHAVARAQSLRTQRCARAWSPRAPRMRRLALWLLLCAAHPVSTSRFVPRLIHQTVADKRNLSCEAAANIASWVTLNPRHTHKLWDDAEARAFVAARYPALLPVPYDAYLSGAERADVFRVLVLHALGGVYADIDVAPLRPIDDWPLDDARVALGVEYYSDRGDDPKLINWVMAAAPGHRLLGAMPALFTQAAARDFFAVARGAAALNSAAYTAGIVARTGPQLLSAAVDAYFRRRGSSLGNVSRADVDGAPGLRIGAVRLLPREAWGSGYETVHGKSCADVGRDTPGALVCHQYWGSWKGGSWKPKVLSYAPCSSTG